MPSFAAAPGIYSLAMMRERVWRWLDVMRPASIDSEGTESGPLEVSPLYSKNDVDMAINQSITARFVELFVNAEELFADEELVDIEKDKPEYSFPVDMAVVRGLWWKRPEIPLRIQPPSERTMMHKLDEGKNFPFEAIRNDAPTYRINLNFFVFNEPPDQDNPGGVLVRYIKWILPLVDDDDFLETQLARILQEVVILDATISLREQRGGVVLATVRNDQAKWEQRLAVTARNVVMPPFANMVINHPIPLNRLRFVEARRRR